MNVQIIDNFLSPEDFSKLQETILSTEFPWYYARGKSNGDENNIDRRIFQFVHTFYAKYSWRSNFEIIQPIIDQIKPAAIIKIKANVTGITEKKIKYAYHRDTELILNSKTACFYLNTNNGCTVLSTGQEIKSVANRIAIFDSSLWHTGTSCTDESIRVVLNFNYFTFAI